MRTNIKILLIGKHGQVGWELQRSLMPLGDIIATSSEELNICDAKSVKAVIDETKADVIINAAAYTAVDKAEEEPQAARSVNADAVENIAQQAKRTGTTLIHYSTDYVFDGSKSEPYSEDDPANPVNVYGETKLAGEQAIREFAARHIILRTSWVYGMRGNNFLKTILRLAEERESLSIVCDQTGSPTWSRSIAETTCLIIQQLLLDKQDGEGLWGTYNLSSQGSGSWYDFTRAILECSGKTDISVNPITTEQYPLPAARPAYSVMSGEKLFRTFALRMPEWKAALQLCLAE